MSRNVYFSQGVQSERNLYEDIVIESIKIYGHEVFYMPRKITNVDEILNEDVSSRFDSAFNIEMYIENVDGYEGDGILMSKFGLEIRNQMKLVVSRKRWDASVGVWNAGYNNFRPSEGDLIYMPTVKGVFEIKFVELETPFYQLQNLPVYKITCELFEYSNEDIDTGVAEVDAIQTNRSQDQSGGYRATFTYNGLRAALSNETFVPSRRLGFQNINGLFVGMSISSAAFNINSYITIITPPAGNTTYYLVTINDAISSLPTIGTGFNFYYRLQGQGYNANLSESLLNLYNAAGLKVGMHASIVPKIIMLTGLTFASGSTTISCLTSTVIIPAGSSIVAAGIPIGAITTSDKTGASSSFTISAPTTAAATSAITATVAIQRWKLDSDARIISIAAIATANIIGTSDAAAAGVGVIITLTQPLPTGYSGINIGSRISGSGLTGTCIVIYIGGSTIGSSIWLSNTGPCTANTTAATFTTVSDIVTVDSGISAVYVPVINANDTDAIEFNFTSGFVLGETVSLTYPNNQTILPTTVLTAFTYPLTAVGTAEISDATAIDTLSYDNAIMTLSTLSFNDGVIHPLTRGVLVTSLESNMSAILVSVLTLVNDEDIADGDIQSQNSPLEIKGTQYLDFTERNPFGDPDDI